MTNVSRAIVSENLWRAQRDGVNARFIDETSGGTIECPDYLASLLSQLAPEIEEFDCLREIERAKLIVTGGTSADFQLASAGSKVASVKRTLRPPWWTGSPGSRLAEPFTGLRKVISCAASEKTAHLPQRR